MDLEPIIIKAMDSEEGYGWTFAFADRVADEYRRFLILCLEHRQDSKYLIVPSKLVDKFWHLHILDTRKYIEDCQYCFGSMLHHFPYFGMRGDQDAANLREAWSRTLALYQSTFNVEPPAEIWPHSKSEIGIRYRDVKREDANPAHRRFDCRRPRLADLERLNGTSHRLEAVKVRLPKWQWKRLHLVPISSIFAFAAVLILAVGSGASSNNTSAMPSYSSTTSTILSIILISGLFVMIFFFQTIISAFGTENYIINNYSHDYIYQFFSAIYAKVEAIQDDHTNQYSRRLTITELQQSQAVHNAIEYYIKSDKHCSDYRHHQKIFFDIYSKIEAIQDDHTNQYGRRLTIIQLRRATFIEKIIANYIADYIESHRKRNNSPGCGGGCGGGGCGG